MKRFVFKNIVLSSVSSCDLMTDIITSKLEGFFKLLAHAKMEVKDHQVDGVRWCLEREIKPHAKCMLGGIIADEMGLGKTITMIATIFCNFAMPTLIVVPNLLIQQWYNEIFKTTGHKALIYHGNSKRLITHKQILKSPIVLTTYGTITYMKNKSIYFLHQIKWFRTIFDEAHHLRNSKTSRYFAAKQLQTKICWLVTGTPVQNKKADFYALCNLLKMPATFYADTLNFSIISQQFILRRTKKQVGLQLQDITNLNIRIPWASKLEETFSANIHSHLSFSETILAKKDPLLIFKNYNVIQLLMRAKQSCVLPRLVKHALIKPWLPLTTSKMDAVVNTILQRKDNGNGKLIFSHYKEEIDTLIHLLRQGGIQRIAFLDGRVTIRQRAIILKEKHDVLILQIQTGAEGLNLQDNYSEIYFVTACWNPMIEDQAIGRCHRIGQTKPVTVFRFEMFGFDNIDKERKGISFDNYVTSIQNKKREIANEFVCN